MSNVYQEKPNIVTVQISDATGTADRFIVGRSLDEVIAIIEPESPCAGPKPKKKDRKPRRTKAEIAAAKKAELDAARGPVLDGDAFHGDKMPDEDSSRKKAAATETVWP